MLVAAIVLIVIAIAVFVFTQDAEARRLAKIVGFIGCLILVVWAILLLLDEGDANEVGALMPFALLARRSL